MSDHGSHHSSRSSSQISHASSSSRKAKTMRTAPKRAGSKTSSTSIRQEDPSLTSFPSLSPEPDVKPPTSKRIDPPVGRTISQRAKQRKDTLAGLVNASPVVGKQNALFDDPPRSSFDIPGSLHLANDDHIERLIARTGAVKLIRQYAQDLAQRDAELSAVRVRADDRERELKRMLRDADIASSDIEKRLLHIEQGESVSEVGRDRAKTSLDGMMNEAMATELALSTTQSRNELGLPDVHTTSSPSKIRSTSKKQSLKDTIGASTVSSRTTSRTNSVISASSQDMDATLRPRQPSTNIGNTSSLQSIFQPPSQSSYFIGGQKSMRKPKAADEASVRSNQSSQSVSSWRQIFGGKGQQGRARASSLQQDTEEPESAVASLSKVKTNPQPMGTRPKPLNNAGNTIKTRPNGRRTPTATRLSTSPNHERKGSNASLPLTVELDSVLQPDSLPPTMISHNIPPNGVLTDRFGFIFDQRRRKRQGLQVPKHKRNRLSTAETIASFRSDDVSPPVDQMDRSSTPVSVDEDSGKKSWQDYLKPTSNTFAGRPKELLLHTPPANAVVTVNAVSATGISTPPRLAASSEHGLLPSMSVTEAQATNVTATSGGPHNEHEPSSTTDAGPSGLLLDQLNELHDTLQAERSARWNDFLRKVRAEKGTNADLDGEIIGLATLGRGNKSKYLHFKQLVLNGIPVSLRPKIWSEACGAYARRIPGYYDDLCNRADEGTVIDPEIASQIKADVSRTLRDNIYFTTGRTGIQRLEEVLRAYSLHNPSIGYCQGMNLIAASLLLICATPEDSFWLLVSIIDVILPSGYFSGSLITVRADAYVLRQYVDDLLPALATKLDELYVELEACVIHWLLSMYAGVLTGGEALYRIWDIVLTLHSTEALPNFNEGKTLGVDLSVLTTSSTPSTPITAVSPSHGDMADVEKHDGTSSPFLFQLALSLLYLNQDQILELETPSQVYTYLNHNCTSSAIPLNDLVMAAERLDAKVKLKDVLERRQAAIKMLGG